MEVTIVSAKGQVNIVNLAGGQSLTVAHGDKIRLIKNGDIKAIRKGSDLLIKKAGSEEYLIKDFYLKSEGNDEVQQLSWYDAAGQEKELLSSEYSETIQTAENETAATKNQTEVLSDAEAKKDDDDGALLLLANSSGKAALGILAGIASIGFIARSGSSGSSSNHGSATPSKANHPLEVVNDINATTNIVTDQSANGTPVGIIALAIDPDSDNTVTYKLIDNAGGRFTIHTNTGVVTVANGAALNHASAQSHIIRVLASSSDGTSVERDFTIHVKDTTPPAMPAAPTSYADNVGSLQSPTSTSPVTDDAQIGINVGSGLTDIPTLYVDGNPVAATYDPIAGTLTPVAQYQKAITP